MFASIIQKCTLAERCFHFGKLLDQYVDDSAKLELLIFNRYLIPDQVKEVMQVVLKLEVTRPNNLQIPVLIALCIIATDASTNFIPDFLRNLPEGDRGLVLQMMEMLFDDLFMDGFGTWFVRYW